MVSEQFVPVEPEGWTDYASLHSLCVCYVLLVYLLDIIGINVHEHAFGTLEYQTSDIETDQLNIDCLVCIGTKWRLVDAVEVV